MRIILFVGVNKDRLNFVLAGEETLPPSPSEHSHTESGSRLYDFGLARMFERCRLSTMLSEAGNNRTGIHHDDQCHATLLIVQQILDHIWTIQPVTHPAIIIPRAYT